jgi:hypothetical protein
VPLRWTPLAPPEERQAEGGTSRFGAGVAGPASNEQGWRPLDQHLLIAHHTGPFRNYFINAA